jgi:hypothetical protein
VQRGQMEEDGGYTEASSTGDKVKLKAAKISLTDCLACRSFSAPPSPDILSASLSLCCTAYSIPPCQYFVTQKAPHTSAHKTVHPRLP